MLFPYVYELQKKNSIDITRRTNVYSLPWCAQARHPRHPFLSNVPFVSNYHFGLPVKCNRPVYDFVGTVSSAATQ